MCFKPLTLITVQTAALTLQLWRSCAVVDWLRPCDTFERRHIGSDAKEIQEMLQVVGCEVLERMARSMAMAQRLL